MTHLKIMAPLATAMLIVLSATFATAQTLDQRIEHVRQQRLHAQLQQGEQPQNAEGNAQANANVPQKLHQIIDEVNFDQVPAQEAFDRWSRMTGIPLVMNWKLLEREGVDPQQPMTLDLRTVPAEQLLRLIMRQASPEVELIHEVTPWYVQVMSKREANQDMVVRVYGVQDLLMPIPNFTDAPESRLDVILSDQNRDGGLFSNDQDYDEQAREQERQERRFATEQNGQALVDLIQTTIEPSIWQQPDEKGGGPGASVSYYDGRLIVRAPMYVQRQIGLSSLTPQTNYSTQAPADPKRIDGNGDALPADENAVAPFRNLRRQTGASAIGPASSPPGGVKSKR